ncbi:MAG: hypothetical protein NT108_02190 [Candidatus Kaiserbacteria bacterium]|nr:hypothetical protein [Candidatus Kaiserbacteria bacterium]
MRINGAEKTAMLEFALKKFKRPANELKPDCTCTTKNMFGRELTEKELFRRELSQQYRI